MKKLLIGLLALGSLSAFAESTSYEKATKLSESNISCQQYRTKLVELLSEIPLNLQGIKIVRDLYNGCVDSVATAIENGAVDIEVLTQELHSKRMICDLETRQIEDLLSVDSGDLDFGAIRIAKEELNDCKSDAKSILNL